MTDGELESRVLMLEQRLLELEEHEHYPALTCGVDGCKAPCPTGEMWELHVYNNHPEYWKAYVKRGFSWAGSRE